MIEFLTAMFFSVHGIEKPIEINKHPIIVKEVVEKEQRFDSESLDLLAMVVQAEAGNQGLMGKQLVVDVILNRVDNPKFPNDLESVLRQSGQFSVVSSGAIYRVTVDEETIEAIRLELEERTDSDILFFCAGGYNSCCEPAYQYGDHYFGYLKGSK